MGRELQKKKRRSGRQPIRQSNRTKKILNPRGSVIIAKNWNKDETLSQNYRRLGLLARLRAPTGGIEKRLSSASAPVTTTTRISATDPFAIATVENVVVSEARVERDADGKIIRILGSARANPLNDPLNDLDDDDEQVADAAAEEKEEAEEENEWTGFRDGDTDVIKSLVALSRRPDAPKPRHQSGREREWLEALVARHGDDTRAMAKDRKLNPMQQTAADIAKRLRKIA